MVCMAVTVIYRVQSTVKTIHATWQTDPVYSVSLAGLEDTVIEVWFSLLALYRNKHFLLKYAWNPYIHAIDEGQLSWLILIYHINDFYTGRNQLFFGAIVCQMTQFVTLKYFNRQGFIFSFFNGFNFFFQKSP